MTLSPQEVLERLAAENLHLRDEIRRSATEFEHKNSELNKAHGREIKVETKSVTHFPADQTGSVFTIFLPFVE